jgi:transposase
VHSNILTRYGVDRRLNCSPVFYRGRWLTTHLARLSRNHDLAKACLYMLRRRDVFTRFLDDDRVCLTINADFDATLCGMKGGLRLAALAVDVSNGT